MLCHFSGVQMCQALTGLKVQRPFLMAFAPLPPGGIKRLRPPPQPPALANTATVLRVGSNLKLCPSCTLTLCLYSGVHKCGKLSKDFQFSAPFIGPLPPSGFASTMQTLSLD